MRLFVAIDLDESARGAIGAEQARLMEAIGAGRSLRWVRPADMHLTLVFVGEVETPRVEAVIGAVRAPVAATPFDVAFAGIGVFPPHGPANVLWLGVRSGATELGIVQGEMAARLERVGVARETRPYRPHLTLARCRPGRSRNRLDRRRVEAANRDREIARVRVQAVTLYHSELTSDGPRYAVLARAPLEP
jgi:2'-5' RNA ligase